MYIRALEDVAILACVFEEHEIVTTGANISDPGMELHDLLSDAEFLDRRSVSDRADKRFDALRILSRVFAEAPQLVLQKLVDVAVEFCGADSAGISLEETGEDGKLRFRWVAISGSFAQYLNGTTPRFFSPCGTCLSSGRPQHYRVTKPYYDFLGVVAEPINDGLLIPWASDESRGTIWAISHGSRETFSPDDYGLLNTLADFAGISVRLSEREGRYREQARLLNLSNDAIITRASNGRILYWNEGAERLYGWKAAEAVGKNIHEFLQTKFPVPREEIELQLRDSGNWTGELVHTTRSGVCVTVLCRKIVDRDHDGFGAVLETNTDITHRKAAEEQLQRSHDELESQVEERTSSLRRLSADLLRVQDDERRRIARELHDSIGQYLAALKMNLAQIERRTESDDAQILADSEQVLDQCLSETRTISHLLHPPLLDESGLRSAAQWYVEGFSKRSGIEVLLHIDEHLGRLPQDVETALFRLLQESLTNVHRHSGSTKVDILIRVEGTEVLVTIRDYGCGFDSQQLREVRKGRARGVGLTGLRERLAALGGLLEVLPAEPGALIKARLPIEHHRTQPS